MSAPYPEALLAAAARAYRRLCVHMTQPVTVIGDPDWWDRLRAADMLDALKAEHLKVVPDDLDQDLIESEEGT